MKTGISLKFFILAFAILSLILVIVGFSYDTKGFVSNILAEITGLFLGIIIAILLVERLSESQQKKRWERVRKLTHRSISHHLNNIVLELFNHFPIENHNSLTVLLNSRDHLNSDTSSILNNLIAQINRLYGQNQVKFNMLIEYFNVIKWDISQIRHDLMPRVIQSSDNQELIDALVEFDDIAQELQSNIIIQKRSVTQGGLPNIISFLEKIRDIYQLL